MGYTLPDPHDLEAFVMQAKAAALFIDFSPQVAGIAGMGLVAHRIGAAFGPAPLQDAPAAQRQVKFK